MLSTENIQAAAQSLQDAEQQRVQIQSISITYPDMDLADAYAVQQAWVDLKLASGRTVLGRKIGLTSRAMQQVMQIDEPDFGTLLDDMLFDDGAAIEAARFSDPRVEVELAFVLGTDLVGDNLTIVDVIKATEYVVPAVELIAARTHRIDPNTGKPRGVLDTISDNAANAGIVLGGRPVKPDEIDLRWVGALLYKNGVIEESGVSAAVLNHPANGILWLARRFAEHGIKLKAGEVILSGSFTRPVEVAAGDVIHVDYGELGSLTSQFV
jgi:2-oxo-hept-3-ene-1,7-dioate hydratase